MGRPRTKKRTPTPNNLDAKYYPDAVPPLPRLTGPMILDLVFTTAGEGFNGGTGTGSFQKKGENHASSAITQQTRFQNGIHE